MGCGEGGGGAEELGGGEGRRRGYEGVWMGLLDRLSDGGAFSEGRWAIREGALSGCACGPSRGAPWLVGGLASALAAAICVVGYLSERPPRTQAKSNVCSKVFFGPEVFPPTTVASFRTGCSPSLTHSLVSSEQIEVLHPSIEIGIMWSYLPLRAPVPGACGSRIFIRWV